MTDARYRSPEQVLECCSCGCETGSNGAPVSAYWRDVCSDAPAASPSARISTACDAWGWATALLGIKGQLQRMRTEGYSAFVSGLLGCSVGNGAGAL
jgi:hypothetical protein